MAATGLTCSISLRFLYVLFISIFLIKSLSGDSLGQHRRFEYKYSFKPPYLAQKDGTVPFWEYGGNCIASSDSVRIAPSLKSQKGAIWTKKQTDFDWWEIEIAFRISGRGRIGADGLAIWYTTEKGDYNGDVFGSSDKWTGLGVFFDSFDNDNKHNNPYIMAVLNDGTKQFDHQNDGTTQLLSGCLRDFRNKPFPTRAKIEYYMNTLTVMFHNGMSNNQDEYELCLRAEHVTLPQHGYFGISAATGGLADDHDAFHFLTTSLHQPGDMGEVHKLPDEAAKLTQEYQDYQRKLELQKEEYRKEHPDHKKPDEFDDWFETDNQREWRQLWQSQSHITNEIKDLGRKMDEMIGRQERTMGLLSINAQQQQQQPGQIQYQQQQQQQPPQQGYADTIRRHEVEALITNQNQFIATLREMKNSLNDLQARSDNILQNQARQPSGSVQQAGYDVQSMIGEMRDGLNQIKQGITNVHAKVSSPQAQTSCPNVTCLSLTSFLVATAIQLGIMLAYSLYKENRNAQAKKFY
ncbi:protein ERGIC-53 [Contarinia nasturtii]|uniref:protein ERGIC-53 n=1 Tax=Contarinia nasturtii TaxID=265458 RepID=UPI0012D436E8|nr:protein ERGIC-53 [Contarinia nasturtii]